MRRLQTHKVPPRTPDPYIQSDSCRIFDGHPILTESRLYQPHPLRQDATCAKKRSIQLHADSFLIDGSKRGAHRVSNCPGAYLKGARLERSNGELKARKRKILRIL